MTRWKWIAASLALLGVTAYASIFPIAEFFTEVIILRTYDADGAPHETRLTIIDLEGGTAWVRGRPYRSWFRRVAQNPCAELYRNNVWQPVRATVSRDPDDAAAFEQAMLESHGIAYQYMDLIARMSSNEVPVRLSPREPGVDDGATGCRRPADAPLRRP